MIHNHDVFFTIVSILCLLLIMIMLVLIVNETKGCWNRKLFKYTNAIYLLIFPIILYIEKPDTNIIVAVYFIFYLCFLMVRKIILKKETA